MAARAYHAFAEQQGPERQYMLALRGLAQIDALEGSVVAAQPRFEAWIRWYNRNYTWDIKDPTSLIARVTIAALRRPWLGRFALAVNRLRLRPRIRGLAALRPKVAT